MANKAFYKYRLFTNSGLTFNILCKTKSRDAVWKAILDSKGEELSIKFFHAVEPESELKIRPSTIIAVDTPAGVEPFEPDAKIPVASVARTTPNRVVIGEPAPSKRNATRNLFSNTKRKR